MSGTLLERLYERWNAHDVDGVLAFFVDDFVYTDHAMGLEFRGGDQLGDFMRQTFSSMPDLHFELFNTFETETHVAAEALMKATLSHDGPVKATGHAFTINYAIIGTVDQGKLTALSDYWNAAELMGEPPSR